MEKAYKTLLFFVLTVSLLTYSAFSGTYDKWVQCNSNNKCYYCQGYYCVDGGGTWSWETYNNWVADNVCYWCKTKGTCTSAGNIGSCSLSNHCGGSNRCGTSEGDTKYFNGKCTSSGCVFDSTNCRCDASDSDNGKNYGKKGTCKDYKGCSGGTCKSSSYTDKCLDSTTLREYYVSGSGDSAVCKYVDKDCSEMGDYECSNGKCVAKAPTCTRANPTVSISPDSQSGNPGETLTYVVSVTNNDNSACEDSTFSLKVTNCPSGWSCSLESNSLTISPGSVGSTNINVGSSSEATEGTYSFEVSATNNNDPSYYASDSANYVVSFVCDGDGVCEAGEDQSNCLSDCKTIISIYPTYTYPGQEVTLTIHFNDSRFDVNKEDFDVKFNLYINGIEWDSSNGCDISFKKMREEVKCECGMGGCENKKGKHGESEYTIDMLSGYVKLVTTCKIPLNIEAGTHTLKVIPEIYSSPILLRAAITKIQVSSPFYVKLLNLHKTLEKFIFTITGFFFK